ncbi:maleylpyruvate isomerase family mycothiol-dependent enzyme [Nocardioides sp. URHA0020]|uniref:maleylpyruvate isomerase family mycothiol-dependent enzyme n=1 Tax=Nocardioides sp. URHA0020 TaxID=1380392 RepID=UPI000490044F|nr:maleylpyruvate isomerase family mycothiol-dependent enzyme [Nocardioides sp. URHA0020]
MSELTVRAIAALRANHDELAAVVPTLSEAQLTGPSGAAEWTVAQVFSHLGSGAEISRTPIATAAGEQVDAEDNQTIWARWDGSTPAEQVAGFLTHDAAYLDTVEGLSAEQHESLQIDMGFLPQPVPLVVALGMRLNEVANHAWDVRVGLDPAATVDAASADLLLELFAGPLSFLLGFSGKADQLEQEVRLAIPGGGIEITDAVRVADEVADPTATFDGPTEAVVRLLTGRLGDAYAADVTVTGNVTLDELRQVFPGY